jgi:DNA-binding transcriptional LysR family regulator
VLNVSRLRVFREVAEHGSFSAAADALSYTQSAVSQQIAALEAEVGMPLLERRPRGVRLTQAGRVLAGHTEGIMARLQAAEAELGELRGLRGGQLRMASFPTAGATLMPLAIAEFRRRHPEVQLSLAEGEPEEIAPRLYAGELDLALLFEFPEAGDPLGESLTRETNLTRVELLEDPLYLALPRAHALARREELRLEELHEQAWVQTSRESPCAKHVVRCCHAAGFEANVAFESDDYQTVQGLVASGVGVALIPELALSVVREDIVVRSLAPSPPVRQVLAALPSDGRLAPAGPAMLQVLRDAAAAYATRHPA